MSRFRNVAKRVGHMIDKIDQRIDKPAKESGTFSQGSEQMIDSEMPSEMGRATSNKRSGFGRGL